VQSTPNLKKRDESAILPSETGILIVDDEAVVRNGIAKVLTGQGFDACTVATGEEAVEILAVKPFAVVFLDIRLPGMDGFALLRHIRVSYPRTMVIMISGYPTIEGAVECLKQGAVDYLVKPFRVDDLENVLAKAITRNGKKQCDEDSDELQGMESLVGTSRAMKEVFLKIRRAAPSNSTVLISGESGTGKELVARSIHKLSLRAEKEFVPVDCSALMESLLESELFGHEKGSFTGAFQTKHGLFELANQGTFFFDEISNLSLNIQAKLLRVIQEREFMKVGSQKRIKLDIRIIASSNRDLNKSILAGTFREDLYYRLSVIPIRLPPLRERAEDIPLLVDHFIEKFSRKCNGQVDGISKQALDMLAVYSWPGNVRELEHAIERIVILEDTSVIRPEHLPAFITQRQGEFRIFSEEMFSLEELEKRYIQFILRRTRGKRQEAAAILGINRKTLGLKIHKYKIRLPEISHETGTNQGKVC
jgi:DNA-binding NtrC family response regulator